MEQIKQYYLKWRSFLNTDKSHLVQSSLALILLLILTPFFPSLDGTWSFAFPRCGTNIFWAPRGRGENETDTVWFSLHCHLAAWDTNSKLVQCLTVKTDLCCSELNFVWKYGQTPRQLPIHTTQREHRAPWAAHSSPSSGHSPRP